MTPVPVAKTPVSFGTFGADRVASEKSERVPVGRALQKQQHERKDQNHPSATWYFAMVRNLCASPFDRTEGKPMTPFQFKATRELWAYSRTTGMPFVVKVGTVLTHLDVLPGCGALLAFSGNTLEVYETDCLQKLARPAVPSFELMMAA